MALGLIIFLLGVFTWLYGKFKGIRIIDFWIYRYSRHPQYFGFLLWSYGLTILASTIGAPKGGYVDLIDFKIKSVTSLDLCKSITIS
jgi:hypothetical protein